MEQPDINEAIQPDTKEENKVRRLSYRNLQIIIGVLVVLLLIILGTAGYYFFTARTPRPEANLPTNIQEANQTKPNQSDETPVIIYAERVSETMNDKGAWPIKRILRKTGNGKKDILAEVGKVGEFPAYFVLSPDKKLMVINLVNKLQLLDLSTKQLKDLFVSKGGVNGVAFSPDGNKLLISNKEINDKDLHSLLVLDLTTLEVKTIKQGIEIYFLSPEVWRDDDKVIIAEPLGESSSLWYFDLISNQIVKHPDDFYFGSLSDSGRLMERFSERIDNTCNDFSGSSVSMYNIFDPVSGNVFGKIGEAGKIVEVLKFSSDDREILYSAEKPWDSREDCDKTPEKTYYIAQISTGEAKKLAKLTDLPKNWNKNFIGAEIKYSEDSPRWSIFFGDELIAASDKGLEIIGQYYQ